MSELDDKMIAVKALTPVATPLVRALDEDPHEFGTVLEGSQKKSIVHAGVSVLVPILQGSIKEIRDIPAPVLEDAIDDAIDAAVAGIRGLFS